ncbi:MAG: dimethylsulfoxide reductase subunit B [Deferribacteraceae bacterium]|jgi:anaerobic dimethyl sulfoxide reductase subunit B (iron-sulfur subunit)|nr:dimethylsulfoxide reductase subunit B [Deferribacteraceae bacterium]
MAQNGFYMDLVRCTGCKTCAMACKDYKDLPTDRNFRRIYEYAGGDWKANGATWQNDVFAYYVSVACNHCAKPVCLENCPSQAISKDENGIVSIDEAKCIGCGSCKDVCPYDAPQFDAASNKMSKCDACKDRTAETGAKPICVEACPLRALDFGSIEELRAAHGTLDAVAPIPLKEGESTEPSIVIKPNPKGKPSGDKTGTLANPLEV